MGSFFARINVRDINAFRTRSIITAWQPYFSILDEDLHTPKHLIWSSPFLFTVSKWSFRIWSLDILIYKYTYSLCRCISVLYCSSWRLSPGYGYCAGRCWQSPGWGIYWCWCMSGVFDIGPVSCTEEKMGRGSKLAVDGRRYSVRAQSSWAMRSATKVSTGWPWSLD